MNKHQPKQTVARPDPTELALPDRDMLPRVLCVDDDSAVLSAIRRILSTRFNVTIAVGGLAGLAAVRSADEPFAVVVSDLRMPDLSGVGLMQCVRQHAPATMRILLTGNADLASASEAVNAGAVFRFLTKPCAPDVLIGAVAAACVQYRKATDKGITAEWPVKSTDTEATNSGSATPAGAATRSSAPVPVASTYSRESSGLEGYVRVLNAVLAEANPMASDCAARIEARVCHVLAHLRLSIADHVRAAASLSQIGSIGVARDITERIYRGHPLSADDKACDRRLPQRAVEFISGISELAIVRELLGGDAPPESHRARGLSTAELAHRAEVAKGVWILAIARAQDENERRGLSLESVLAEFQRRGADSFVVDAFRAALSESFEPRVRTMRLRDALPGMTLAADVFAPNGLLVAPRGQLVRDILTRRVSAAWSEGMLEQPVRVFTSEAERSTRETETG